MSFSRAAALPLAVSLAVLWACSGSDTGRSSSSAKGARSAEASVDGSAVAAEVNGEAITWAELEKKAAGPLTKVRQEEYEIRSRVVDELIAERLIEAVARERDLSSEELLEQELEQRVEEPKPEYIEALYGQNKERFKDQSRAQALARIEEVLLERAERQGRIGFVDELREQAAVTVHLAPPRVAVDIPSGAPATGPKDAPVTIVEFTDYQCPYCRRVQPTIQRVLDEHPGKVRHVIKHNPLSIHPQAPAAARAAIAADRQGRFWEMHKSIFADPRRLSDEDLRERAREIGLDMDRYQDDFDSEETKALIAGDQVEARRLGATGTPSFFINGRLLSGAQPYEAFKARVDEELGPS
jgi:protein-disulfide isomerase